jgi:hypothetical protein
MYLVLAYSAYGLEDAATVEATTEEDAVAAAVLVMDLDTGVKYRFVVIRTGER